MNITLDKLEIENFKGIKHKVVEPEGRNAVIRAENGIGKTTVYDGLLWLLFGKNSEGVSQFGIVPCDAKNKAIRGIVVCVEAYLGIDDKTVVIKKEMHEKVVKKQLKGYSNYYWINDVPKKEKEFVEYIKEKLIAEDIFKMLTDLTYFNDDKKLSRKDRRAVLMDFAGEVTVAGYDGLLELVGEDRTLDEYKTILAGQKKGYEDERKEINPRIDEIQHSLNEYATADNATENAEACRDTINESIAALDKDRTELINNENARQGKIEELNGLKLKQSQREQELQNDNSAVQALLDEKEVIEAKVREASGEVTRLEGVCSERKTMLATAKSQLEHKTNARNLLSEEKKELLATPLGDKCPSCQQALPDNMKDDAEKIRTDTVEKINKNGKMVFQQIKDLKSVVEKIEVEIAEATECHSIAQADYKRFTEEKFTRFEEIGVKIAAKPKPIPERDDTWAALEKQIHDIAKTIGKPATEQLAEIEGKRKELSEQLETINKTLAQADTIAKSGERIKELGEREKELGQKIADVEAQLFEIGTYRKTESELIEEAVNDKFEHTTFKLFDYHLNGEIKETCIATYNGIDYGDMSTGQHIFVGMDIVNVLADHYKTSVVLFIDHLESLTMPLIAKAQTIGLFAEKGVKELVVEIEEDKKAMVA